MELKIFAEYNFEFKSQNTCEQTMSRARSFWARKIRGHRNESLSEFEMKIWACMNRYRYRLCSTNKNITIAKSSYLRVSDAIRKHMYQAIRTSQLITTITCYYRSVTPINVSALSSAIKTNLTANTSALGGGLLPTGRHISFCIRPGVHLQDKHSITSDKLIDYNRTWRLALITMSLSKCDLWSY